jgi:hypothetical protein
VNRFSLDVIKKLRYFDRVIKPNSSLEPDWDEDNVNHIAEHGLRPEQIEEVYYNEGPFLLSLLKLKSQEVELLNIVIGYGAPMHLECILRPLLPHTLNSAFGGVSPHSLCHYPHRKHT